MANCNMATLPLILAVCAVSASAFNFPLNVDCGSSDTPKGAFNMTWVGDDQYVRSGQNRKVLDRIDRKELVEPLSTLRCFPLRKKNCYSFLGVGKGKKILVRAWFHYGNYDEKKSPPTFDLLFNGNRWTTVSLSLQRSYSRFEVIHVTKVDDVSVCLVRTNPKDVPFINSIEIKLLNDSIYKDANDKFPLYLLDRYAYGYLEGKYIRYPNDSYDRRWQRFTDYENWSLTPLTLQPERSDNIDVETAPDKPPVAVVRKAVTTSSSEAWNLTIPTLFNWTTQPTPHYVNFYFSEVWANASRSFDILLGDEKFIPETISVPHGSVKEISKYGVNLSSSWNFTLVGTDGSTHPPLINAAEFFKIGEEWSDNISTDASDAKVLSDVIQKNYPLLLDWSGDPCLPSGYAWEWIVCSNDSPPRVTTLNLSGYGLTGLLVDFGNLSAIQTIDLHNNSLSGSIPEFLGNLPNLMQLNLADNQFSGSVPESLISNPKIKLNISGNNISANNISGNSTDFASSSQKKTDTGMIAGATISVFMFLLLLVMLAIFIFNKRPSAKRSSTLLESEDRHDFSHADIVDITNNFQTVLGAGASGNVYYGKLGNGVEVAVKVLKDSLTQGTKEFVSEAKLLMTVHHRCLVSFVGYCEEGGKLILLYEYMSGGNLRQLLSGRSTESAFLTWERRLQIALRVATGLDYLHSGCYPPIIHRDVKTTNILLNAKMEAKVADFGLSKVSQKDDVSELPTAVASMPKYNELEEHIYSLYDQKGDTTQLLTAVAGTPGYIDPEYYTSSMVTKKSDVYSFGVVLLELITGYPPIFNVAEERFHIVQWVTPKLARGDIHGVADRRLRGQYNVNSMWKIADIAMSCASKPSHSRPNMTNIIDQLKEAIEADSGEYKSTDNVQLASSSSYETSTSFSSSLRAPPAR